MNGGWHFRAGGEGRELRVITTDVPKQEMMTHDNVPVFADAVVYFRVMDPVAAIVRVENYLQASSLIAQTTLRSVIGQRTDSKATARSLECDSARQDHPASRLQPRENGSR